MAAAMSGKAAERMDNPENQSAVEYHQSLRWEASKAGAF
jgi:hypothetical protein